MVKYEIEYPIYAGTCEIAKKEDYEKGKCDLDYGETLSTTYKNALKKAVKFLKKNPHTFVGIHDYDDYYDTCRESCDDMVEVIDECLERRKLWLNYQEKLTKWKTQKNERFAF